MSLNQIEARIDRIEEQIKALESMDKRIRELEKALEFYVNRKDGEVARKALYGDQEKPRGRRKVRRQSRA